MPKLRFPGFEGEWTRNRLDEVASVNPASPEIPLHFYYIDLESVDAGILSEIKEITKSDAPSRAQREVRINDILFQTVRPYQKNNYFMQEEFGLPVFASTGYAQIRTENNPYFLYSLLHTKRFLNNVLLRCTGSSYPAINSNDLKEIEIYTPCQLEQSKLSLFMSLIDKRIEKQKQLIETVKKYKRGLLSAVFPGNSHVTPKYRLSGFSKPWKQRKLGDIADIKTGPFGSTLHADDYVNEGIPIITTEHFKSGKLPTVKNGIPQVSDDDYLRLKGYTLKTGDIVFSRVGSVDINALVTPIQDKWLFSGRVLRVRSYVEIVSTFLHTLLETDNVRKDIISRAVGQTMPSINTEILKATLLCLPQDIDEQLKIGSYFAHLDRIITLHQCRLNMFEKIKFGMLQQLFI